MEAPSDALLCLDILHDEKGAPGPAQVARALYALPEDTPLEVGKLRTILHED
jgi:hypothetical protein